MLSTLWIFCVWKEIMKSPTTLFVLFLVLGALGACTDKGAKAPKAMISIENNAHTKVCLAHGDQADGKIDKVIAKCPACSLAMFGSTKYKTTVDGYEVHSCSSGCNSALEADANKVFAKLDCRAKEQGESGLSKGDSGVN